MGERIEPSIHGSNQWHGIRECELAILGKRKAPSFGKEREGWGTRIPAASLESYKLRRKFKISCCCDTLRLLKLLITPFASELHTVLED